LRLASRFSPSVEVLEDIPHGFEDKQLADFVIVLFLGKFEMIGFGRSRRRIFMYLVIDHTKLEGPFSNCIPSRRERDQNSNNKY
jgi:hypothetical protein